MVNCILAIIVLGLSLRKKWNGESIYKLIWSVLWLIRDYNSYFWSFEAEITWSNACEVNNYLTTVALSFSFVQSRITGVILISISSKNMELWWRLPRFCFFFFFNEWSQENAFKRTAVLINPNYPNASKLLGSWTVLCSRNIYEPHVISCFLVGTCKK